MRDERISLFLEPDEVCLLICHLTRILRRPEYQEFVLADGKRKLTLSGIHPGNAAQVPEHLLEVVEKYFAERGLTDKDIRR